jgi:hypothetical protein
MLWRFPVRAVVEACSRTAIFNCFPVLHLAVFVPPFFMIGVSRQLFVPLFWRLHFP